MLLARASGMAAQLPFMRGDQMLNIPEAVKALFKQDGVFKNFRCHFPNGELHDITNENIVQESVKFQESVCSHDVFKFGLTEASVIEFETVGVGNMYGMTIECATEVDCSPLSAAEIADIEAGTWDGEYVPLADSDLGFPFFRVSYGVFRVESCPRDHQAMTHRRVTAYSEATPSTQWSEFLVYTEGVGGRLNTFQPDLEALSLSAIFSDAPDKLLDFGYTKESVHFAVDEREGEAYYDNQAVRPYIAPYTFEYKNASGSTMQVYIAYYYLDSPAEFRSLDLRNPKTIIAYTKTAIDKETILDEFLPLLDDLDLEQSGFSSWDEVKAALWGVIANNNNNRLQSIGDVFSIGASSLPTFRLSDAEGKNTAYYVGILADQAIFKYLSFNVGLGYYTRDRNSQGYEYWHAHKLIDLETGTFSLYTPDSSSGHLGVSLSYESTGEKNNKYPTFIDAFDPKEIINGFLDMSARFVIRGRDGTNNMIRLSDSSPAVILPGQYSQMWFDEYDVQPIGVVRYAYTDAAGENQVVDYVFGNGASLYDMSDNAVFKSLSGASQTVIESLLDIHFIPYLAPINFVPIDLAAKGLPYLEAGDALSVTAQDGTVCNSYALRRELDGVQVLTDQIDSQSGLIIDSGEDA